MGLWDKTNLKEVSNIMYGYTAKASLEINGPKYLRITDIQDQSVNWSTVPSCQIDEEYEKYALKKGDIVFARTGATTGKSYLISNPPSSVFASYLIRVQINNSGLLPEFLYKYFETQEYWDAILKGTTGSAQGGFNATKLGKLRIPIPPLAEQKRIVEILDKAFEAIDQAKANIEKNIQNAEELFQSKLNEIFSQKGEGWEEKRLKEITSKIGSGATPRGGRDSYKESGISLIRSMNVYDEGFVKDKLAFIDNDQANKLSNVTIEEGDVLLNITGASVARCCVVPDEYLPARVNQHVSIIRLNEGICFSKLLQYSLTSKVNKDRLIGIGEQGATRQAITKVQIEDFLISYPIAKADQKSIIQELDIYKTKSSYISNAYRKKINNLEQLKKSILQKAFSGELTGNEEIAI